MNEQTSGPIKAPEPNTLPIYEVQGDGTLVRIDDPIKVSVSASQKVNLGNYESADVFFSLSNIPSGATEKQIEAALETAELTFNYVKEVVRGKAATIRKNVGR